MRIIIICTQTVSHIGKASTEVKQETDAIVDEQVSITASLTSQHMQLRPMSTQSAIRSLRVSPVDDIDEAVPANACKTLVNLDVPSASARPRLHIARVVPVAPTEPNVWSQTATAEPASRFRKGGMFALVAFAHAVAFYALTHLPPQITNATAQPIQVVMVSELQRKDVPPPPMQLPRLPTFDLPLEPVVIDIAEQDTTAITVAARPAEPVAATVSALGTPKTVSSVEYIREPVVKYPQTARVLKQRGTVTLRALVDVDGTAHEVNVHRSSGFRLLDDAARAAVLNALFKPYMESGRATPVYVFVPIEFGAAAI